MAHLFVNLFYLYLGAGLAAALFLLFGGQVEKIDPAMKGASWKVRLLLVPGATLLWVVLLARLIKSRQHGS
ncbi:MAG: hypothetical protein H6562_17655 [Lewinellaceae bacterium]|nr:hypothetical protein [Lewinella sp.]MCB9280723.1 hypothetical protein [Lewinellaceae bacterium]